MFSVKVHELESGEASAVHKTGECRTTQAGEAVARFTSESDDDANIVVSGNSFIEKRFGILHLFRNVSVSPQTRGLLPTSRSEQVCILAIPNYLSDAGFQQFIHTFLQSIEALQIVRNHFLGGRYSSLIKFESQNVADDFFKHFNGKPFSSFGEEVCHVLFIVDVQYTHSAIEASTPPVGLTELPTCPVCLERLDQHISGISTAIGNVFPSSCISKWSDSSCTVCRYCQEKGEKSTCSVCSTSENLWICVICGFVGCGRYQEGHAIRHWKESQHCYSLEVETQRVWDYAGDGYVHRLIQSKTDGKLVELNSPCQEGDDECGRCECSYGSEMAEAIINSKIDGIAAEYNQLLTSQLDEQRQYFECRLAEAKKEKDLAIAEALESLNLQQMQTRLEEVEKERRNLKQMNDDLKANQDSWQAAIKASEAREKTSIKERDERIADLEEQVRDLMVYIEAQKTLGATADIRDGTVLSLSASVKQTARSSKTKGKKRR
ncbi:hypothetical protein KP509_14G071700 [Ceratopteris richardii]|uniref:UBP-type domain-containing protein n=1 Tax=Ceratopteris richardii TaxID=49495 RepID=A0A8T2TE47_CERRI|nr:hypothetical protein KP509_14G071700 [Ceratopteris richardii]